LYLTRLQVEGLRAAPMFDLRWPGRDAKLPSGPLGVALLDALELFAASCVTGRVESVLRNLGVAPAEGAIDVLDEKGLPIQAGWTGGDAGALVGDERKLTVHVELALDPPLFGRLREEALRDPRLVNGLSNGEPSLTVRVGWIFTKDLSTVSIGVLRLAVGDVAFPIVGGERPKWAAGLLQDIGARIHRVRWHESSLQVAERLMSASLSAEPERRARYALCRSALGRPPFNIGVLELVRVDGVVHPCFGPELLRARQLGPASVEALQLAEAVLMHQPDLLLVENPGSRLSDAEAVWKWLASSTSGEEAILEQVLAATGGAA
jgi:hypothetical protein